MLRLLLQYSSPDTFLAIRSLRSFGLFKLFNTEINWKFVHNVRFYFFCFSICFSICFFLFLHAQFRDHRIVHIVATPGTPIVLHNEIKNKEKNVTVASTTIGNGEFMERKVHYVIRRAQFPLPFPFPFLFPFNCWKGGRKHCQSTCVLPSVEFHVEIQITAMPNVSIIQNSVGINTLPHTVPYIIDKGAFKGLVSLCSAVKSLTRVIRKNVQY